MTQYGFLFNTTTCIGCHSCQFACAEEKRLAPDFWLRRVAQVQHRERYMFYSGGCNHCVHPACVQACQSQALYRDEQKGVVLQDASKCIGCGGCTWSCPYGAVNINLRSGKSSKCDSCLERRRLGQQPACVAACPTQSLRFGTMEQLESLGGQKADTDFLPPLQETDPSLRLILRRGDSCICAQNT